MADSVKGGFSVTQTGGVWWLVAPDGKRALSRGVDCIGAATPRKEYDPANPGYSFEVHSKLTREGFFGRITRRLKSWGFNTVAGWSDADYSKGSGLWFTPVLHIGVQMEAPWVDMWVAGYEERAKELAKRLVGPYRGHPNLLGYFMDNEFGWGDEYFLGLALGWPAGSAGRKALRETLERAYDGDFDSFAREFQTTGTDWGGFEADAKASRRPGKGHRAIDAWMEAVARRYYAVFAGAVRDADPGKLVLGDRFRQYYPQGVARGARGVLDIISTNYEATTTDGWISPVYFESMHELSGCPVMVGEFYTAARQNRSGNRNSEGAFTLVDTQVQRAECVGRQVRNLARIPCVVGWHWFQYYDEPAFGRGDGEDYNMGLVDIYDEPYEDFTRAMAKANAESERLHSARKPAVSRGPLPVSRQRGMTADGNLLDWDKSSPVPRSLLEAEAPLAPFADVFLAWDEDNLWLAVRAYDFTIPSPVATSRHDQSTWGELHKLTVESRGFKVLAATGFERIPNGNDDNGKQVIYSTMPARGQESPAIWSHVNKWHYVWEMAIPCGSLGKKRLKKGDRLSLSIRIENRGDYERMSVGKNGKLDIILK